MTEPRLPDDDAYGRVTDRGRYLPLHDYAERIIAQLVERYEATAIAGTPGHFDESHRPPLHEVVRVSPTDGGGGTVVIGFTTFPGIAVRVGQGPAWTPRAQPVSGC